MLFFLLVFFTGYAILMSLMVAGLSGNSQQTGKFVQPDESGHFFVSVIVAMRNEAGRIATLLRSLSEQSWPMNSFEIIFCDDASEDNTVEIVKEFAWGHPYLNLRIIGNGQHINDIGKKAALERGLKMARGEIILFTDADTWMGPDWLRYMAGLFHERVVQMVLGPVRMIESAGIFSRFQALESYGILGITAGSAGLGWPVSANGANLAIRKESFYRVGGFRKGQVYASGDDQFLMLSFRKHFGKNAVRFALEKKAEVCTGTEPGLASFFNQRLRWISKSGGYREPWVIGTGIVTAGLPFMVVICLAAGVLKSDLGLIGAATAAMLLKMILDLYIVLTMKRFTSGSVSLAWYLPAQLFQLIYVPVLVLVSGFKKGTWKGRKL